MFLSRRNLLVDLHKQELKTEKDAGPFLKISFFMYFFSFLL